MSVVDRGVITRTHWQKWYQTVFASDWTAKAPNLVHVSFLRTRPLGSYKVQLPQQRIRGSYTTEAFAPVRLPANWKISLKGFVCATNMHRQQKAAWNEPRATVTFLSMIHSLSEPNHWRRNQKPRYRSTWSSTVGAWQSKVLSRLNLGTMKHSIYSLLVSYEIP